MQIPKFLATATIAVALLISATVLLAQDTVSISDPAEFGAYSAAVSQNDPKTKAAGLERFLTMYPQSVVKKVVLDTLLDTYTSTGDSARALNTAARLLQTDPNNMKAIYVSVFIKKTQCEKNQDAQSCNDAAALAQKGLVSTKGAGVSDADWERQAAAAYPLFRSAIAKVGGTEQAQANGNQSSVPVSSNRQEQTDTSSDSQKPKLTEGKLLQRVAPVYPPDAKAAGVSGTVVLKAVIGKDGLLNSIRVVSGSSLLQQAAIDCVKQWKYQPYLLGGQPVEVETTLNIGFTLGDGTPSQQNQTSAQGSSEPAGTRDVINTSDPKAQYNLAVDYYKGTNGKSKDANQAAYWWQKSAEQGNPMAQFSLGVMYYDGLGGLPKDETQAVSWYQKAADSGVKEAQYYLALIYLVGGGGLPKDNAMAVQLIQKAADKGLVTAQATLGQAYAQEKFGLPQNDSMAAYWLRKAAEQGDAGSEFSVGLFYETARGGFPHDSQEALVWYVKAAEQCNLYARTALLRLNSPATPAPVCPERISKSDVNGLITELNETGANSRFASGILSIESKLDNSKYEEAYNELVSLSNISSTFWPNGFRLYYMNTEALRQDLKDYTTVKEAMRQAGNTLSDEVIEVPRERATSKSLHSEPITSDLLNTSLAAHCASIRKQIEVVPHIHVEAGAYELPIQFATTTPSNAEQKVHLLGQMLGDWNTKLSVLAELRKVREQPDVLSDVDHECTTSLSELEGSKRSEIDTAYQIHEKMNTELTKTQTQIQEYSVKAENARLQAEEVRLQKAIAGTVTPWSKAQCTKAINNFINHSEATFSARAATLWLVSENLAHCENYSWTYEERNQLALPIPFKQVEDSEQKALAQSLNAKIVNFIQKKNLTMKFAWEVGHNTILPSDSIGFLRRNGLEQEFQRNDYLEYQKMDAQSRLNVTHAAALLFGVVTQ
jgi:TonB family protein